MGDLTEFKEIPPVYRVWWSKKTPSNLDFIFVRLLRYRHLNAAIISKISLASLYLKRNNLCF